MPMTDRTDSLSADAAHVFAVRVYYEDTDAAGIVYYANYLKFAERARTEMMRALGMDHARLLAMAGVAFAVRRCVADFRSPARLDDLVAVRSRIIAVGGASVDADQTIWRGATELVRMRLRLACMTLDARPARIPSELRAALFDFCDGRKRSQGWKTT
jgi:acyl-CoA thioester hydrolase